MNKDLNQCINDILSSDPVNYRMELFYLKSSKDLSDHDREIVTQYYYMVRAFAHVAKKRFKYQFDMLLKYHAPVFWKPNADMLEQEWFADGLLEVISLIREHIRDLHFDLTGLTEGNYGGIKRIEFEIEDYKLYIDYLQDVHEYIHAHDWRYDEYLQINVYDYKIHTLDMLNQLKVHGITLEDIIDDINKRKNEFYTIAIFWYLGAVKRVIDDTGKTTNNALGNILKKWFLHDAKANTIAIYLSYFKNHDNNTLTETNIEPSYETIIDEVKKKYINILGV